MPIHTAPSYEGTQALDNLVARLEERKETVVSVVVLEGKFVVVTNPPPARAAKRVEKRPAVDKAEKR